MPKRESPAVVIIYTPHIEGVALMTGCKKNGECWMYTKFQIIGETEVQEFIDHYFSHYTRIDKQAEADTINPGMSSVTPIILVKPGVSIRDGVEAFRQLHLAMLKEADRQLGQ
jgi:hypothetical protein